MTRIARAVPFLVVIKRHFGRYFVEIRFDVLKKLGSFIRVTLHFFVFVHVKARRFFEDQIGNGYLTHIMEHDGEPQHILLLHHIFGRKGVSLGPFLKKLCGIGSHTVDMRACFHGIS